MKKKLSIALIVFFSAFAEAQTMGTLQINGKAGKFQLFQKVKAVRCNLSKRGDCAEPLFLDLNKPQAVQPGFYLLGFENTLHPDIVEIRSEQTVVLNLKTLSVPAGERVKVYRDFSSSSEQNKILMAMYYMNRHFFRLENENFGDLYLTSSWSRDFVQRFSYEICPKIKSYGDVAKKALEVCQAWNSATGSSGLKNLYDFSKSTDGTFVENWVTIPGDAIPSKHPRYLVSVPTDEETTVAVFPGAYKIQIQGKKSISINVD